MTEPLTHKGWTIHPRIWTLGYEGISPNYDASYEGDDTGWVDNGERVFGKTVEEVKNEIDAWLEENTPCPSPQ